MVLFDKASVHTANLTKQKCLDDGIELVFNLPYFPILNACEAVILAVKTNFKNLRLQKYMQKEAMDTDALIKDAID